MLEVRETNLPAQVFFRSNGFRAISVMRNFYDDTPEDAYAMQFRYRAEKAETADPVNHTARLTG
jgi:ribosomal-protein-alanine N-acetyltransferase